MQTSRHVIQKATNVSLEIFKRGISRMKEHKVVPDVIPSLPKSICEVEYEPRVYVDMGNVLTPTQVKDPPFVRWDYECGKYYTLCMTDPDAPSREEPEFREWHHWLVVNIEKNRIPCGEVLSEYISSAPPECTGLHRYVFLVYQQPKKMCFDVKKLSNKSADGRAKFSIAKFAQKYELGCEPVAGNFFQAEWDEYVPEVYKKLGAA